jgi:DNA-binding MarR family transcriptional regulator
MQVVPDPNIARLIERLVAEVVPGGRGIATWMALLRAHATLVRQLAVDLVEETGLTLGDYDVLSQLALAGGVLRMTDLANRAFSSRSGMTRRVDRLVGEGLVGRTGTDTDGRGVVVGLTKAGLGRLSATVPAHIRRVAELFVAPLDDQELAVLERALEKVTLKCTFG